MEEGSLDDKIVIQDPATAIRLKDLVRLALNVFCRESAAGFRHSRVEEQHVSSTKHRATAPVTIAIAAKVASS